MGPGSYVGHKEYKVKQGYCAFSSLTERTMVNGPAGSATKQVTPGPGVYSPNECSGFDKIGVDVKNMKAIQEHGLDKFGISLIRPTNNFASKIDRFGKAGKKKSQEKSPEPGQYTLPSQWNTKGGVKMRRSQSQNSIELQSKLAS